MPYTLVSADMCPYVERVRILLAEKAIVYEAKVVDLKNKPDWFLAISPRGRVPLLQIGDEVVFESSVINELLEELHPEHALLAGSPIDRARARGWIVVINDDLLPALAALWFKPAEADDARARLKLVFAKLEAALAARKSGAFFLGDRFGLVDVSIAPIWNRWPATEKLGYTGLLDGFPLLDAYRRHVTQHPSVLAGVFPELTERFVARLTEMRAGK